QTVPAYVLVDVGLDQPPGEYTAKVTVTDRANGRSQELKRQFEVLPKGFGLVRLSTTCDQEGQVSASLFQVGGSLWVNYAVVGFPRPRPKGAPRVTVELRVLDDRGQPTLAKPFTGEVSKDVPEKALALPVQFLVSLNRPGKFTVEVKATDQVTKKTAK